MLKKQQLLNIYFILGLILLTIITGGILFGLASEPNSTNLKPQFYFDVIALTSIPAVFFAWGIKSVWPNHINKVITYMLTFAAAVSVIYILQSQI